MKILMVNKFLHAKGGTETYVFKLGEYLQDLGHEIQYFGMEHEKRKVGNRVGSYTSGMDFHGGSRLDKLLYPIKTIYSAEARKKIRLVLEDFQPDVCHLNNFNYQLTPSILLEIRKWERESGHKVKIVFTAHDYQLVCPNHMCNNPNTLANCEKCLGGHYLNCVRGRCIHGSLAKSAVGALEAAIWNRVGVYKHIDTVVCCSGFLKSKLDTNPSLVGRTVTLHNFVEGVPRKQVEKKDYVLYFGRFSKEKGIVTLLEAAKALPQVPFVFAGSGPLEHLLEGVPNIRNVGFQRGEALETLIREAKLTVYPSEWYENCPFSVMESILYGTPVLGADIGGIPELIQPGVNGEMFESGNREVLIGWIRKMWEDENLQEKYDEGCANHGFMNGDQYFETLGRMYRGEW